MDNSNSLTAFTPEPSPTGRPGPDPDLTRAKVSRFFSTRPPFTRRLIAAVLLVILAGAATFIWRQHNVLANKQVSVTSPMDDALPGHLGAILTLADQQQMALDNIRDGPVTTQGESTVSIKNGQLAYFAREIKGICGAEFGPLLNTLTTPKGRQFQFTLTDGTQVWLNAASSITYPTEFCEKERTVSITGEAYLEVAKDPSRPFTIKTNNMQVEVLGTNVDINTYSDEGVTKTTLLEGTAKVKNNASAITLQPGQQASLDTSTTAAQLKVKEHVNLEEVLAWENGFFEFNNADIHTVLRQLSRWYNLETTYEGAVPDNKFTGKMRRTVNASDALKALEQTHIHFRIAGNKLIVIPAGLPSSL